MKRLVLSSLLLALSSGCAAVSSHASSWVVDAESVARTDALTAEDVVLASFVTDVEIAPDGKHVAYVLRVPRPLDDPGSGRNEIWLVDTRGGKPTRLSNPEHSSSQPRWSPDGNKIAFTSRRPGHDGNQIFVMPAAGGEAMAVTEATASVQRYAWSPDGKSVAYTATIPREDRKADLDAKRDWIVNEEGGTKTRLFIQALEGDGEPTDVVKSDHHVINFEWSPDGKRFAVNASDKNTVDFTMMYSSLYTVAAEGGELTPLTKTEGKLGAFAWSPDSKKIAFLSAADIHDSLAGIVKVVDSSGGDAVALTPDLEATASWVGWQNAGTILFQASQGVKTTLNAVPAKGGAVRPIINSGPICHDLSYDGKSRLTCAGDTAQNPREVYIGGLGNKRYTRATVSNPELEGKKLGEQRVVQWKAADGVELEGILILPVGYQKGTKYPLAVLPHGGPEGVSQDGWRTRATYPAQIFATAGYVVFEPNYRGSAGRGTKFAVSDQKDLGGKEFQDVLAGIDHLANEGLIDPNRVGMGGWSYGGYFSGLAATKHTDRFKAAMIGAAVINWISFTGTTEIEHENSLVHWNLWPWDDMELAWDRSPLAHIKGAKTPALVVHGAADSRVPPGQGLEIYRGLKHHGVDTQLVMYPREPHGLIENVHSVDFINRFVGWFDKYVKEASGETPVKTQKVAAQPAGEKKDEKPEEKAPAAAEEKKPASKPAQ